jgi:CspA family cold shock protein
MSSKRKKLAKCRWHDAVKGYGFLSPQGGQKDIFVHYTNIMPDPDTGCQSLDAGENVSYEEVIDERTGKMQAIHVTPLDR